MIMIIIHEMAVILRGLQPLKKHVAYICTMGTTQIYNMQDSTYSSEKTMTIAYLDTH